MTSATWRLQLLIWCEDLWQRRVLGVRLAGFLFLPLSPSGGEGFYERDAGWGQGALGSCFKYPVSSKIYVNHATSLGFVLKFGKKIKGNNRNRANCEGNKTSSSLYSGSLPSISFVILCSALVPLRHLSLQLWKHVGRTFESQIRWRVFSCHIDWRGKYPSCRYCQYE